METDTTFESEEVQRLLADDPDVQYLLPDDPEEKPGDQTPAPVATPPVAAPPPAQAPQLSDEEIERLAASRGFVRPPQQQQQTPDPNEHVTRRRALAQELSQAMLGGKPEEAFEKLLENNERYLAVERDRIVQTVQNSYGQVAQNVVAQTIQGYERQVLARTDLDDDIKAEFQTRLKRAMQDPHQRQLIASLPPQGLQAALDDTLAGSYGSVMLKRPVGKPRVPNPAPHYAGGPQVQATPARDSLRLTDDEKALVRNLERELPASDDKKKIISQTLKEYREEKRRG